MHIPDGFIPLWQCAIYTILMFLAWAFTIKWVVECLIKLEKEKTNIRKIFTYLIFVVFALPLFVFFIEAVNIPVPFGTSIQLLGAALVAIILRSPWGAVLVMTPVLIVQGLIFGDGGLTTLGANLINIGVIGGFTGFYVYKFAKPLGKTPRVVIGGFLAGLVSLVVVAAAVALEMWMAGTFPLVEGIISMTMTAAVLGIFEGIMTMTGCIVGMFLRSKNKIINKNNL
ncbi:MAG: energy-coupling factor ABC transporter permease [Methanobacteriaceae archaeon]|nr:energy-coupling factor ABC transporter permease [Methanobacteriaceae archaeon]